MGMLAMVWSHADAAVVAATRVAYRINSNAEAILYEIDAHKLVALIKKAPRFDPNNEQMKAAFAEVSFGYNNWRSARNAYAHRLMEMDGDVRKFVTLKANEAEIGHLRRDVDRAGHVAKCAIILGLIMVGKPHRALDPRPK